MRTERDLRAVEVGVEYFKTKLGLSQRHLRSSSTAQRIQRGGVHEATVPSVSGQTNDDVSLQAWVVETTDIRPLRKMVLFKLVISRMP